MIIDFAIQATMIAGIAYVAIGLISQFDRWKGDGRVFHSELVKPANPSSEDDEATVVKAMPTGMACNEAITIDVISAPVKEANRISRRKLRREKNRRKTKMIKSA